MLPVFKDITKKHVSYILQNNQNLKYKLLIRKNIVITFELTRETRQNYFVLTKNVCHCNEPIRGSDLFN